MSDTTPPQVGDPSSWGPERSRTITWHDPVPTAQVGLQMSGLDYLNAMGDGGLPQSPIAKLINLEGVTASEGEIVFRCVPDESTYNPLGIVHGGLICTALDSAAGCAVHTTLPAGVGYTSTEIKVNYMRPVMGGTELTIRGWVTKPGRRIAFAEAEIRDPAGKLVANATSTLLILNA
ncbi:PaaI family thioesterase [Patulibacter sp.]|uniref:PaaI family thioesterase n=1 Tax=Patulibacter sp. TaxID=1912859 RepID=UPI002727C295|nr:PaaI family thioesterase [Patulibacter sp.]MDO9408989.1 PaaI family thioesterase [Patulibacter sp.]